ncbi:MAG: hypothetical protein O6853_07090 [Actinobacteria bacterium]|nr:hypothetical protein [Actinomycetota bacterium]
MDSGGRWGMFRFGSVGDRWRLSNLRGSSIALLAFMVAFTGFVGAPVSAAESRLREIWSVRAFESPDIGLRDPATVGYSWESRTFVASGRTESDDAVAVVFTPAADDVISTLGLPDGEHILGVAATETGLVAATSSAFVSTTVATLVRTYELSQLDPPSPDSAGIAWLPDRQSLIVSDSEVNEVSIFEGVNLFTIEPSSGDLIDTGVTTAFSNEPTGVSYDPVSRHLFISDDSRKEIFHLVAGPDNRFGTPDDSVTSFDTDLFGSTDPEGVAFGGGRLYIADGANREVFIVDPGSNGIFDGVPIAGGDDVVSQFDVAIHGASDPEGIVFREDTGSLLVVSRGDSVIFELTTTGALLGLIDISAANPDAPAGIAVAPASDGSGDLHIYVVDRGVDNNSNPSENDGRMYEFAGLGPVGNFPPVADAGGDQTISVSVLPASAVLDGSGSLDDSGIGSFLWEQVSGPGLSVIEFAGQAVTSVSLPEVGDYTFRLTVTDDDATTPLSASDESVVTVFDSTGLFIFESSIATGSDDVEESGTGSVKFTSSDLELVVSGSSTQTVGLRFTGVNVPLGATITDAWVQFRADEVKTGPVNLMIQGHATDNAGVFVRQSFNVSGRPGTVAAVGWVPVPWDVVGEADLDQQTPNLASIVQELVLRPGWSSGNAIALIVTGTGTRTAESFEGGFPPLLHIEYTTGP